MVNLLKDYNYMRFLFGFLLLLIGTFSFAQSEPVTWTIEAERIAEDEYEVSFTAKIENGWSIYSPEVPKELGPVPTTFQFDSDSGIQLVGTPQQVGQRKKSFDPNFGTTLTKFLNRARFSQRIKVKRDTTVIKGQLTYMTCDATSCLPPADLAFEIDLEE